jgi:hypothetical protein
LAPAGRRRLSPPCFQPFAAYDCLRGRVGAHGRRGDGSARRAGRSTRKSPSCGAMNARPHPRAACRAGRSPRAPDRLSRSTAPRKSTGGRFASTGDRRWSWSLRCRRCTAA